MQQRLTTRLGLLLAGMLSAASSYAADFKPWSEADDFVRIEAVNADNQQPYSVTPEQLRPLLASFYKKEAGKDPSPYFTEDEVERLSKMLAPALARSKRVDDILFASSWRPGLFLLTPRQINAGRIFIDHGSLNLIVGMCDENQDESYFEAHGHIRPLNHASRIKPVADLGCELLPANGADRVDGRPDWLRISLSTVPAQTVTVAPPAPPAPSMPVVAPAASVAPPAAVAPVAPPPPRAAIAPPAAVPAAPSNKLEERLMMLKRLHDNGVLTDEEYEKKRAATVKDL